MSDGNNSSDSAEPVAIVPLTRGLNRETFDCGVAEMNAYLRRYALQNEENHLSRTRIALIGAGNKEPRIVGFYVTAWATVNFSDIPLRGLPKRYPFQVGLLGQLAVDRTWQGRGLGSILLLDALARFELLDRINPIPAIVLDLREEALRPFYARHGFVACGESAPSRMYLLMKTIESLRLNE